MAVSSSVWQNSPMPDFMALESQISDSISEFFTKAQMAAMSEYEKQRYRNIRKNYEMMNLVGMPLPRPDFMRPPRQKRVLPESSESESDAEWTPSSERGRKRKDFKAILPRPKKRDQPPSRKKGLCTPAKAKPEEKPRRYPVRVRKVRYMSLEIPDDDYFLFCEECNKEYEGDCPVHGPLNIIQDAEVAPGTRAADRAWKTLPPGLSIQESTIPGAGLGVVALQPFPTRTQFGPYKGDAITDPDVAQKSGYCWQIYTDGQPSHFVDACSTRTANWMRFVNCACTEEEQNLTAYQYQGQIYYRSYKPIPAGSELLVWYGEEYAKDLGIQRNVKSSTLAQERCSDGIFPCAYCRLAFSTFDHLRKHTRRCHSEKLQDHLISSTSLNSSTAKSAWSPLGDIGSASCKNVLPFSHKNNCCKMLHCNGEHTDGAICHKNGHSPKDVHAKHRDIFEHEVLHSGECPYKCEQCGKAFNKSGHLRTHMRTHTGERPYKCEQCGKAFSESGTLRTHMRTHTGECPYKCEQCGKAFSESGDLHKHMRTHTGECPYKCEQCGKAFSQSGDMHKHMRTHTGECPYKCEQCGKAFSDSSNLHKHMRTHTGERPYKCEQCGKAFSESGTLRTHMRTHTGECPYKCEQCGKAFSESGTLRTHTGERPYKCEQCGKAFSESGTLRTHTGERPYKCEQCGKAFNRSSHLHRHMRTHTGECPYKCEQCGKAFNRSGTLHSHMRTHTGERPYKCEQCGKAFNRSGTLHSHMRTHTGECPYKCEQCGKAFNRSGTLHSHMRTHTGERPYKCEQCGKAFSESGHLHTHMRTHTGECPYKCEQCGKIFNQSSNLHIHMRTHTGEHPYKCEQCGKAFSQSSDLHKHMRTHTGERPYKCEQCGKAFNQSSNLHSHMRNVHAKHK